MNESKIGLTERLRREGRWAEASKLKDTALADFRAKGMKRPEAAEAAWAAMAEAFPPLSVAQGPTDPTANAPEATAADAPAVPRAADVDIDALLDRLGDRQRPDLVRDVLWAYENLSNRRAKPIQAPSVGAWAMLEWARQYRNRFFEQVLPKAMTARSEDAEDEEMQRRERKSIAEIGGILGEMQRHMDEELRADVPGILQERVRDMLSNWGQQCGVSLAVDARARLDSAIVGLLRDSLRAFAPSSGGE